MLGQRDIEQRANDERASIRAACAREKVQAESRCARDLVVEKRRRHHRPCHCEPRDAFTAESSGFRRGRCCRVKRRLAAPIGCWHIAVANVEDAGLFELGTCVYLRALMRVEPRSGRLVSGVQALL